MKQSDKTQFIDIIGSLAEIHSRQLSETAIKIYWFALKEFTIEQIKQTAAHLIKYSEFMPKPADFTKILEPADQDQAQLQAQLVLNRIMIHGSQGRPPTFADPTTRAVLDSMGGYKTICRTMTQKQEPFWKREFRHLYLAHKATSDKQMIEAAPEIKKLTQAIGREP
ncbi:MAG: hypothetical protein GY841_18035 [FCB group bacterium]|nr:hypothetical protein [FCB group bacterium]